MVSHLQYTSRSTVDLLTVTGFQHGLCYPSCSTWYTKFFWQGLTCQKFPVSSSVLLIYFLVIEMYIVVLDKKYHKGVLSMLALLKAPSLSGDVICNITIYVDGTTQSGIRCHAWQQLELAFEMILTINEMLHWERKWLLNFSVWNCSTWSIWFFKELWCCQSKNVWVSPWWKIIL